MCWSGNDDEYHESKWGGYNCHGVISVTSNVLPSVMRKLTDSENPELAKKVTPFMHWLFAEPNPIALNTVLAMTGQAAPVFRSPYFPYRKELRAQGVELLKEFMEEEIYGGKPRVMEDGEFKIMTDWENGFTTLPDVYIDGPDRLSQSLTSDSVDK